MIPTAARSVVGRLWIAASGRPAAPRPSRRQARIARADWKLSEPPRRIAALPALRQSAPASAVTFGRELVDDPDHAQGHPHAGDVEAVRALPARHLEADRIGERGHRLEAGRHGLDAPGIKRQPIEQRGPQAASPRRRQILGVRLQDLTGSRPEARGCCQQGPILGRTRGGRQDLRRIAGALAERSHLCFEVVAQRGRHGCLRGLPPGFASRACLRFPQGHPTPIGWPTPRLRAGRTGRSGPRSRGCGALPPGRARRRGGGRRPRSRAAAGGAACTGPRPG